MQQSNERRTFDELLEVMSGYNIRDWDYELSDYRITTGYDWAHVSFIDKGQWIESTDSIMLMHRYEFFETALMIRENDKLKIDFYSNTYVLNESEPIK